MIVSHLVAFEVFGDAARRPESFAASVALEWPLPGVHRHVISKLLSSLASFAALAALERQFTRVCHSVNPEGVGTGEGGPALGAQVVAGQPAPLVLVEQVRPQLAVGSETVGAVGAWVGLLSGVKSLKMYKMLKAFSS